MLPPDYKQKLNWKDQEVCDCYMAIVELCHSLKKNISMLIITTEIAPLQ